MPGGSATRQQRSSYGCATGGLSHLGQGVRGNEPTALGGAKRVGSTEDVSHREARFLSQKGLSQSFYGDISMDISMGIFMDISIGISRDISLDIVMDISISWFLLLFL